MPKCLTDAVSCHNIDQLSALLKVVAEPNRLKILCLIAKGEQCVCEIVETTDLAQNLVSHHLGLLRKADIVTTRREGTNIFYQLNAAQAQLISQTLADVLTSI